MTAAGVLGGAHGPTWWVRLRALLAAGLVLGAGTTSSLAAWTDQSVAQGQFAAGTFDIEANPSKPYSASGPWNSHTDMPAVLQFSAAGMTPGSTRYAPVALRSAGGSVGGTGQLKGATVVGGSDPGLAAALRYRVVSSSTCSGSAFTGAAPFVVGSSAQSVPLTTGQGTAPPLQLPANPEGGPGATVRLCFEMTLPTGAATTLQGKEASVEWQIQSTSTP